MMWNRHKRSLGVVIDCVCVYYTGWTKAPGYRSHMSHEVFIIRTKKKKKKELTFFCGYLIVCYSRRRWGEENSLSLSLQDWRRREQLTAADISQIFSFYTSWQRTNWSKNIDQTQDKRIFSFSAGAYIHYTDHMYTRETIIIHVMWAAHSWTVEPIYKHIYSPRHSIHSPDDDEKLHFEDLISFFLLACLLLLYDADRSLMNWTSEYVLALYSITLVGEGSLLFLSHLLYRTDHVCLLMILSLFPSFRVFFALLVWRK
jgi:hypothetical protein